MVKVDLDILLLEQRQTLRANFRIFAATHTLSATTTYDRKRFCTKKRLSMGFSGNAIIIYKF